MRSLLEKLWPLALLAITPRVLGCTVDNTYSDTALRQVAERSDAVFIGRVTEILSTSNAAGDTEQEITITSTKVVDSEFQELGTVEVVESFKGKESVYLVKVGFCYGLSASGNQIFFVTDNGSGMYRAVAIVPASEVWTVGLREFFSNAP